ncbi:hypothetical protein [Clostridium thermobutyricum]|uniref:hypothetical protein n=1 Tax=Clostridium thermobutyricum TaxID=29372 RepID=UPI0029438574|nr:hypothetical protein [Clostridium thermobutyricum]
MEINDILNGFNESDCDDSNSCDCNNNRHHNDGCNDGCNNGCNNFGNNGCNNNFFCWFILIILLCGCNGNNRGGRRNNCCCCCDCCCDCCCEKPRFKKCKETFYVPVDPCFGMMNNNQGWGGFGCGNSWFVWIILILICCCGSGFNGNSCNSFC